MRYGWSRIVIMTWRYDLPRARLVFAQCYSADPGSVIMRAAPREYSVTVTDLIYVYEYQFVAMLKAEVEGNCDELSPGG